jgi:threonyl-tRNA synthetase
MKIKMKDGSIQEAAFEEELGKKAFWHTTAHILAQAVKRLYPDTKCAIGPSIANGFYYDFEFSFSFSEEYFEKIEGEMRKIVKENLQLRQFSVKYNQALQYMKERNEPYKLELLDSFPENEEVSFYQQGEYLEMCAGPHAAYTSAVKAFKLLSVAGSYWRGDEKNKMLTRIYGISFPNKEMLKEYLNQLEEARKRDHRKLGKELQLFMLLDEGPGFPFFLPKGMILKNLLIDYWRKIHTREGYVEISTPIMLNRQLWETSGHWEYYKENMYTTVIDETDFAIKPMNCPGGMLIYKKQPHSYRDLPMRVGELGLIHRHEKSGQLHGLMRVRCCTQDDAHIFMMPEQITDEIKGVVRLIDEVYSNFGFKYHVELSTRPEHSIGSDEDWEMATNGLKNALDDMGFSYNLNEGDGAFYGPKIDFHLEDSIGRTWQCGTIQLDLQLPQRFDAEYIGADGKKHRPIMIHRVVFGSIERFMGILIEHFAGKFPLWLSPVQVKILTISDKFFSYTQSVENALKKEGIRCEIDTRAEKIGYKIREARLERVPYIIIVGEKEAENNSISVRKRDEGELGNMSVKDFLALLFNDFSQLRP